MADWVAMTCHKTPCLLLTWDMEQASNCLFHSVPEHEDLVNFDVFAGERAIQTSFGLILKISNHLFYNTGIGRSYQGFEFP